ncbi:MAG: helix-turn-helix domain-containing protein, partial [Mycobacteriales bacterium]
CRDHPGLPRRRAVRDPLAEAELRWRPDGRVLEALYAQSDSFYELTSELRWHREHVQHLEQLDNDKPRPAWMSVQQAADYAGRSVSSVRTGLARGDLKGTRPRGMKSWSLRPADVDAWLSQEAAGPTPRRRSPRR